MPEVAAIILAAAVGAISGILTTSWKTRKDLESQYDIDLRKHRIDAYKELWRHLQPLADYSPPAKLTYDGLHKLSVALREWYFDQGGLFLSVKTRAPYFHLQQALTKLAAEHEGGGRTELDPETATIVKTLGSRLRTCTTEDVATRVGPRLGPSLLSKLERRWHRSRGPLRVSVDRRWDWAKGEAEPRYFVLVENRSDREVVIDDLELGGVEKARVEPALPVLVQAGEPRELEVTPGPEDGVVGRVLRVTVRLEGGEEIRGESPPDVPLRTDALVLPERRGAGSG